MGLLNNLFGPDTCSICGNKLGLTGNQDLSDDVMCKECGKNMSPYLTDRKSITVAQMLDHVTYRLDNENNLLGFKETRHLNAADTPIYVDETNQCMLVCDRRFFEPESFLKQNPDIIWLEQITGIRCRLQERRSMQHGGRPEYLYNFQMEIYVNATWFNLVDFPANIRPIEAIETARLNTAYEQIQDVLDYFKSLGISAQFCDESGIGLNDLLAGRLPAPLLHPERPIGPSPMERGAAYGTVHGMRRPESKPLPHPERMDTPRPMNQSHNMGQAAPHRTSERLNTYGMNERRGNMGQEMPQHGTSQPTGGMHSMRSSGSLNDMRSSGNMNGMKSSGNMNDMRTPGNMNNVRSSGNMNDMRTPGNMSDMRSSGNRNDMRSSGNMSGMGGMSGMGSMSGMDGMRGMNQNRPGSNASRPTGSASHPGSSSTRPGSGSSTRPTGSTSRPSGSNASRPTGSTSRPSTGSTSRPSTGSTSRPSTGSGSRMGSSQSMKGRGKR